MIVKQMIWINQAIIEDGDWKQMPSDLDMEEN